MYTEAANRGYNTVYTCPVIFPETLNNAATS